MDAATALPLQCRSYQPPQQLQSGGDKGAWAVHHVGIPVVLERGTLVLKSQGLLRFEEVTLWPQGCVHALTDFEGCRVLGYAVCCAANSRSFRSACAHHGSGLVSSARHQWEHTANAFHTSGSVHTELNSGCFTNILPACSGALSAAAVTTGVVFGSWLPLHPLQHYLRACAERRHVHN